ncbi:MAG: PKD domain-containing protein, partial [bacterium]|nr:PKD domain-containing protein [bacterium]
MKPIRMKYIMFFLLIALALPLSFCKKGAYVAGEGDSIQITAASTSISPGAATVITITGIKADGRPMPDDTLVQLAVDIGKLLDAAGKEVQAALLASGTATVTYQADDTITGGTAAITASSGTAAVTPEQLIINIMNTDISSLTISADPSVISPGADTSKITVTGLNSEGGGVSGKMITIETSAGILDPPSPLETDPEGKVETTLTTTVDATITATYQEATKSLDITVGINLAPTADFEFSPQNPVNGDTIFFTSTSIDTDGEIVTYHWNLGDGTEREGANTTHTYDTVAEQKEFKVIHTVTDNTGATAIVAKSVIVSLQTPPTVDFSFTPESPNIGDEVRFTPTVTKGAGDVTSDSYYWDFGDGQTSRLVNPVYDFPNTTAPTVYNVLL